MRLRLLIFLPVFFLLIFIVFLLTHNSPFNDSPKYKSADLETEVGVGYSLVLGTKKYPNSQLVFLANLKNAYVKGGKAYADFIVFYSSGKLSVQTFTLFDNAPEVFLVNKQDSNQILPNNGGTELRLNNAEEIIKQLNIYKGKNFILHLDFGDPDLLSTGSLKYLSCNEAFHKNYIAQQITSQCSPLIYNVSIYEL